MDIKVGDVYKFKDICKLLGKPFSDATNKKVEYLEEFERYCRFDRPDNRNFVIEEVYNEPKIGFENGFFYKTMIIPVKCSKDDYQYLMQCSKWAGDCWNKLVKADNDFYKENGRLMQKSELQSFVKNITPPKP